MHDGEVARRDARRGSGGSATAAFARAGACGDTHEVRRVRKRNERGKHPKVGAFNLVRSRTAQRPWRSTVDIHDGGKEQGARGRRRSNARTWTMARTCEGSQSLCLCPTHACAKATVQQRPQPRGERVGGVRCKGETEPKARPCLPNGVRKSARVHMPRSRPRRRPRW
jgi:hypothetical protein